MSATAEAKSGPVLAKSNDARVTPVANLSVPYVLTNYLKSLMY